MSEKTTNEVKNEFQAADVSMLPELIHTYEKDGRQGVQRLVMQSRRRLEKLEVEKRRIYELRAFERKYKDAAYICGIDEAGRGPLAGPVVAGAVVLPKDCEILYINDSKKLTEKKREELYEVIMEQALAAGVGMASAQRIDEINILQATYEAMREAVHNLGITPDILLNDAVTIPQLDILQEPIVKGDARSISIGAASIIAKVTRDRLMVQLDQAYPGYGFAAHKGYGTKAHIAALRRLGPCEIHRKTFITKFV